MWQWRIGKRRVLGCPYSESLESVSGENYEELWVELDTTILIIETADGRIITYEF